MPRAALALLLVLAAAGAAFVALRPPPPDPPVPVERHGFRLDTATARTGAAPVVWAVGDGADGSRRSLRVARLVAREDPDALLYLGDVYERGTAEDFERKVRGPYRPLLRRMLPTPGNHEWPRHAEGYDRFWKSVTGRPTAPWYATRIGGWQVLSLNSQAPHGARSEQLRWLRARLRGGGGTCRIAFWHRPRFNAGRHGDQPDLQPLWDAVKGKVALVLNGHDHNVQRFKPRDGTVQIVSGTGGRESHEIDPDPRLAFGDDDHHGGLRIRLHPRRADVAVVTSAGEVLDRSSVRCRRR